MAKARSDSVLKLRAERDPEFGAKIWEWLHAEKTDTCPGGQRHAIEQLRLDGVTASNRMLTEFSQWWELRLECSDADRFAEDWIELLQKQFPGMSPEKIAEHRQTFFTLKAANAGNAEEFREMEYLALAKQTAKTKADFEEQKITIRQQAEARAAEKLIFERQKFMRLACEKILEAAMSARVKDIAAANITHAQKIEAMGQAMFGEDWNT
jgi:hypothetical protein